MRHALHRSSRERISQVTAGKAITAERTLAVRGVSFHGQISSAEVPSWGKTNRITAESRAAVPTAARVTRTAGGTAISPGSRTWGSVTRLRYQRKGTQIGVIRYMTNQRLNARLSLMNLSKWSSVAASMSQTKTVVGR